MNIFVAGGTGKIGTPLVPFLLERKLQVTVLTRSEENAKKLPPGAQAIIGDLLDTTLLRRELGNYDGLFLNCSGDLEIFQGLNAIDIARRCGTIRHLVYISGQTPPTLYGVAHCGVKYVTERVIKDSGIPYTILQPNTFMQNDEGQRANLNNGTYGLPLGRVGASRIDTRDIAELAAIAFSTPGHAGKSYIIGGPEVLTGAASATVWGQVLGKPIKYIGPDDDMDLFEEAVAKHMPRYFAHDLRIMYEVWGRDGFITGPEDIKELTRLLGRPPRPYLNFVREMAVKWGLLERSAAGAKE